MSAMSPVLSVNGLTKSFVMHAQGELALSVLRGVSLDLAPGECLALVGPSGAGKSTLVRSLYGNYRPQAGSIRVRHRGDWVEMLGAEPRVMLDVRRHTMGFVSQFLRVIPRVAALDVVAEPALRLGMPPREARGRAEVLLDTLGIARRLWRLPPATFSGGEQQRINIARSLVCDYPVLLLDEPTAALDTDNRNRVVDLVRRRRDQGAAIVGIFHDTAVRDVLATRLYPLVPPGVPA
jgi:alpha-D-ribose 1-methylphosphonate 5-triphosphate synthase subunit PhnL